SASRGRLGSMGHVRVSRLAKRYKWPQAVDFVKSGRSSPVGTPATLHPAKRHSPIAAPASLLAHSHSVVVRRPQCTPNRDLRSGLRGLDVSDGTQLFEKHPSAQSRRPCCLGTIKESIRTSEGPMSDVIDEQRAALSDPYMGHYFGDWSHGIDHDRCG